MKSLFFISLFLSPYTLCHNNFQSYVQHESAETDTKIEFHLKEFLNKYERPLTILDLRGYQDQLALKIAPFYDCVWVIAGNSQTTYGHDEPYKGLSNLIILDKKLTWKDLQMLTKCEHFDVVLLSTDSFPGVKNDIIETMLKLGEHTFIESSSHSRNQSMQEILEEYLYLCPNAKLICKTSHLKTEASENNEENLTIFLVTQSKNILQKPFWNAQINIFYTIISNFKEKFIVKPRYTNELIAWKPGINLWTYKHLQGSSPSKKDLQIILKDKFASHKYADFTPWDMLIQGKNIEFVNEPNEIFMTTDDSYQRCLQLLELN